MLELVVWNCLLGFGNQGVVFNGLGECAVVCAGIQSMVCGCMGKSLVCIGYVSHLLYVGLVYRVGYLVSKVL